MPTRNPDAIAERIANLSQDKELKQVMAAFALDLAARSPWSRYEAELAMVVEKIVLA